MNRTRCYNGKYCGSTPCECNEPINAIVGKVEICTGRLTQKLYGHNKDTRVDFVETADKISVAFEANSPVQVILPGGQVAMATKEQVNFSTSVRKRVTL